MTDLSVPKHRVRVELLLAGGERREAIVFLAAQAEEHSGPERVSDLLAREEAFFPAEDAATGETWFVARGAVAAARVARALEPGDGDEHTLPTEHEVEVALRDRQRLRGTLSSVLPPDHSRGIDFLNEAPRFFRLLASADDLLLVHREHVVGLALSPR